jgi:hypothetical protein
LLTAVFTDRQADPTGKTALVIALTPEQHIPFSKQQRVFRSYQSGLKEVEVVVPSAWKTARLFVGLEKTSAVEQIVFEVFNISLSCDTYFGDN